MPAVPAPVVHREPSPSARCRHRCRHCHHHPRVSATRPLFTRCKPPILLVRGLFWFVHFWVLWEIFFLFLAPDWLCLRRTDFLLVHKGFFLGRIVRVEKGVVHLFCIYWLFWGSSKIFKIDLYKCFFRPHKIEITRHFTRCKPTLPALR